MNSMLRLIAALASLFMCGICRADLATLFSYDSKNLPPGQEEFIDESVQEVQRLITACVPLESSPVLIHLEWAPIAGSTTLINTSVHGELLDYDDVIAHLIKFGKASQELAVYNSLPGGSSIPVQFSSGTTTNIDEIFVPYSLLIKWNEVGPVTCADMVINTNEPWDYSMNNGVGFDRHEFYAALLHEVLHVLGFQSELETPTQDAISVWDMFRLSNAVAGAGVNATILGTTPRMLNPGVESVGVTAIGGPSLVFRLSTGVSGDGRQGSHWKDDAILGSYVGVMDPRQSVGPVPRQNGLVLHLSDLRAIDIIGWGVDIDNIPPGPGQAVPQAPPNNHLQVGSQPTLQWAAATGAVTYGVYVFQGQPSDTSEVYSAAGITATQHVVPYGALEESTQYTWRVTSFGAGFNYSSDSVFTTRCYADCNSDGVLSLADFGCFQTKYATGDPEADCNEDSILSLSDFGCFSTRYALGCP